ncbi:MAG: 3-deoxy-7-phosphoheptulonate synthase [Planctomycetes bacterium]|nr:3-deoxy-7-phosphoheptulonate synthase [Planctomycetota bacterium]
MIIVMKVSATEEQIQAVTGRIEKADCVPNLDRGAERVIVGIRTGRHDLTPDQFENLPGVDHVVRILKPYKLASREFHPDDTVFKVGNVEIGGNKLVVMAGPCGVESEEQIFFTAKAVKASGADILRGGAFKPRTSPYAFQGMGEEGLKLLSAAGREYDMPVVTEVVNPRNLDLVAAYADIIQIGARNMQNFELLKEAAALRKPIFLKRGLAAKIEDLLMSAEYLLAGGCDDVILCERGIRTFETATRNTLDISAVPVLKKLTHLPVVIDPSHASGVRDYIPSLTFASIAVGADGLMIEVHPDPACAHSDGPQSLPFEMFDQLMKDSAKVAAAVGRSI